MCGSLFTQKFLKIVWIILYLCRHDTRLSFTGIHYILGVVESISHPVLFIFKRDA
jgi:hypothetical protein